MSKGIKIRVWGDYGLFSRPELKVERFSYDIITPSAARGILDAIYWHPGMRWIIDKIYVIKPIKFITIRRNEVKNKVSCDKLLSLYNNKIKKYDMSTKENIVQRSSVILSDIEYVIEAHFEITDNANKSDNEGKFISIINRRIESGKCYHTPYFGCREFPVNFRVCNDEKILTAYDDVPEKDLGIMLYDMDFADKNNIEPLFYRAIMKNGVIDLKDCEVYK